ncbi:pentatricopeptide repeat-containing protein 1, mitochondrial [Arctopsyche grandis]|uniref:pentatricopeptide repeat-containing protein 1, mitochondrial n=1 Tax=Arctopsyche grandis TaxID=121162 RepID=UPI00406D9DB8
MSVLRFRLRLQLQKAISLSETHIPVVNHGFSQQQAKPISYTAIKYHLQTVKNAKFQNQDKSKDLIFLDDPDSFGLMSKSNEAFQTKYTEDEGDNKEEEKAKFFPAEYSKLSIKKYSDLIKEHLENGRIKEAIDILEVKMLEQDKKTPDEYIYNLLISGCAQVGYTKKAFMLFNDMKRRGLKVTGGTYTSLFNACSNSPFPEDGASRAYKLKSLMEEKLHEPNLTNYNSMIKAFGRCGDLKQAFGIVDEMVSKKIGIRVHTFNFLLQACITDKVSGFRHALLVWRKMLSFRERPNEYSFNLMLRCIKECGLGEDINLSQIGNLIPELELNQNKIRQITEGESTKSLEENVLQCASTSESALSDHKTVDELPNLIAKLPHMGSVLSLNAIKSPQDRFMLVGGLEGFINEIKIWSRVPNIKTATLLLDLMPNTNAAEETLFIMIKVYKVKTDIDFYNFMIRRRCFRFDYVGAKDILNLIEAENSVKLKKFFKRKTIIKPNIMTYGILALTCGTIEDASKFLLDMKDKRLRANTEIMGTLLKNAIYKCDFEYVIYILNFVREDNIVSNKTFTDSLGKFKSKCKYRMKQIKANPEKTNEDDEFVKGYEKFLREYDQLMKNVETYEDIENEHPWKQYRENQPVTFQRPTLGKTKGIRYHKRPSRKHVKYVVKM